MGLEEEDFPSDIYILWPENVCAFNLFNRVSTQWRVSAGGVVGLDYNVIYKELERMNLDRDTYEDVFEGLRIMEVEALARMRSR